VILATRYIRSLSWEATAVDHAPLLSQLVQFWSNAERESELARADPTVQAAGQQSEAGIAPFRAWLDEALSIPWSGNREDSPTES
jgi:hypothetical protein